MKANQIKALQVLPILSIALFIGVKKQLSLSNTTANIVLALLFVFTLVAFLTTWKYKTPESKKSSLWLLGVAVIAT